LKDIIMKSSFYDLAPRPERSEARILLGGTTVFAERIPDTEMAELSRRLSGALPGGGLVTIVPTFQRWVFEGPHNEENATGIGKLLSMLKAGTRYNRVMHISTEEDKDSTALYISYIPEAFSAGAAPDPNELASELVNLANDSLASSGLALPILPGG
jgi:hypothetical protein